MKIGLINEDSQADKNAMIFDILKQEAEKKRTYGIQLRYVYGTG